MLHAKIKNILWNRFFHQKILHFVFCLTSKLGQIVLQALSDLVLRWGKIQNAWFFGEKINFTKYFLFYDTSNFIVPLDFTGFWEILIFDVWIKLHKISLVFRYWLLSNWRLQGKWTYFKGFCWIFGKMIRFTDEL